MNFLEIIKEVQSTRKSIKIYPKAAVKYFGVTRRGWRVNEAVNRLFEEHDVMCEPKFEHAYFYGQVEIQPKPKVTAKKPFLDSELADPTPRLSLLKAANINNIKDDEDKANRLVSVQRDTPINQAITLMLINDYSQLPILSGERNVEGIISWKSIGRAMALDHKCLTVNDCKEEVIVLNLNEPLFNAVRYVLEKEVVLVKHRNHSICGIVTITDIGEQFISLAEPFLIIEQIENYIRRLLDGKFSIEELNASLNNKEVNKPIENLSDLTFGQYLRIMEVPDNFEKLGLNIDRVLLINQLEEVRKIRNDVMHFDPATNIQERIDILRQTASFFHILFTTLKK